jgi:hypothetical protein
VNEREDVPEGTVQRNVRMSETLFQQLGASRVDWGEPDAAGAGVVSTDGDLRAALTTLISNASDVYENDSGRPEWVRVKSVDLEAVERAAVAAAPATPPTLDAGPEVMAWFHESEEICSHELEPWPCQIMADHLLRDFAVEPRLTVNPDGTAQYPPRHFHRLEVAARLSGDQQGLQPAASQAAEDRP